MSTKKELQDKMISVAHIVTRIADENGKQYRTDDQNIAELTARSQTIMCMAIDKEAIERSVNSLIKASKISFPTMEIWSYMCMLVNWFSWAWYELGENELSKYWADAWYKINDYSLNTLKGDKLKKYLEITD